MFSLIYHFIIYSRNNADAANFLDVLRQAVAAAPQAPQAAVLNATRETMPFLVYPSNFFNEDQTAEDNLSFSSDYYKLPFDPDMGNAVGSLTTALNELDTNLTNPNLPKNLQKPIPSIVCVLFPKDSPIYVTEILNLLYARVNNYHLAKMVTLVPTNEEEQESVLQSKMDHFGDPITLILVDCWDFSKTAKDAAITGLSVAQKVLKHGQGQTGAAVRARGNGGGAVKRGKHQGRRGGRGGQRNNNY